MDPQQRLFLETCWHALQDSGRDPWSLGGSRTSVFAGVTLSDYLELLLADEPEIAAHTVTGGVHSIVPNRVSHVLDLRGPSEAIDAACASLADRGAPRDPLPASQASATLRSLAASTSCSRRLGSCR